MVLTRTIQTTTRITTTTTITRLISIESQPKRVVVDLVVVFVFVAVIIVGHKNLTLKFGQNWVNDK